MKGFKPNFMVVMSWSCARMMRGHQGNDQSHSPPLMQNIGILACSASLPC
jgi:hypothetical protein